MASEKETSLCKELDLLCAIFGKDVNEVRAKYGLLPKGTKVFCLNCGKPTPRKMFCSRKCVSEYHTVQVVCSECGILFPKLLSVLIPKRKAQRKLEEMFCSRECFYKRWRKGFRKYDEKLILDTQRETGYGAVRLSRLLNIPISTITHYLKRSRKSLKERDERYFI